jgi:hypothetical protein
VWASTPHVPRRSASDRDPPLIDHDRREHLTAYVQRSVRRLALSRLEHWQNTDVVALGDAEDQLAVTDACAPIGSPWCAICQK